VPNPTLDALAAQVTSTTSAEASAITVLNGIAARIQAAVDAAVAGGASAADLAPVQAEVDSLKASSAALAAAVAANTGTPPAARKA
jgi:hypothetical protein